MSGNMIGTILVEDQEITRLGIKMMLKQHIKDVLLLAEATNGRDSVRLANEMHPALVLMDIGLPDMDGIEATRAIKELRHSKVIIITSHDDEMDIIAGLSAGADAYCFKDISSARLANAIDSVMGGAIWLEPQILSTLLRTLSKKTQELMDSPTHHLNQSSRIQLTEREQEVLNLLVAGLSNQQISEKMSLGAETIKTHMRHLIKKMKVSDRTQAAVKALREGLLSCA